MGGRSGNGSRERAARSCAAVGDTRFTIPSASPVACPSIRTHPSSRSLKATVLTRPPTTIRSGSTVEPRKGDSAVPGGGIHSATRATGVRGGSVWRAPSSTHATRTAIRDAVGTAVEQKVDEVKEGLRERIGGAFKKSDDDGDEEAEDDGGDGD